ncbi:MAG TPA: hypothetical protein VN641_09515, partial [Urbifossiella sp.]|nr:hypothetical protein [Urbifossiella sp.]
ETAGCSKVRWGWGMLLGGTGFQPVCLYLHRLEAGATQESSMIIALPHQRLLLHPNGTAGGAAGEIGERHGRLPDS